MAGLVAYGSGSGSEQDSQPGEAAATESSEDSYFQAAGSSSEDSTKQRLKAAQKRQINLADTATGPAKASLPAPLGALSTLGGRPAFLDPAATRPIAQSIHLNRPPPGGPPSSSDPARPVKGKAQPGDWDVAKMAPRLKGGLQQDAPGQPRSGAVISAAPVRNRQPDEDAGASVATAAQIAMLGGQWKPSAEAPEGVEPRPPGPKPEKRKSTPAMGVNDFLDKGGGAALPRQQQDRKDREKNKRVRGQSTHASWKSEAEMVLRQQYD